jgi:hypothetical protein
VNKGLLLRVSVNASLYRTGTCDLERSRFHGGSLGSDSSVTQLGIRREGHRLQVIEQIEIMEAAIGIEPMNKGFAVRPRHLSPSITECHTPVFIDLFERPCYSVILKIAPDPPQKSPQSISRFSYAAFDVGTRLLRSYSTRRAWCVSQRSTSCCKPATSPATCRQRAPNDAPCRS